VEVVEVPTIQVVLTTPKVDLVEVVQVELNLLNKVLLDLQTLVEEAVVHATKILVTILCLKVAMVVVE
tara:strand:- start:56 stop:259 length:204 start_codon:yes stop_codon:yes gene_type:complete